MLVLALPLAVDVPRAEACSCLRFVLAERTDEIEVAFVGEQTSYVVQDQVADRGAVLTFEVDEVYEGDLPTPVNVRTEAQSTACGVNYGGDGPVGVVAYRWKGRRTADSCTGPVTRAELRAVYGKPHAPSRALAPDEPPEGIPHPESVQDRRTWTAMGAVLLLGSVLTVGALAVRRRRS